jgi:hypothetical protein
MHIGVPDEISIAGYDDIEIMAELPIPITTVRVLSDEVGRLFLMARLGMGAAYQCDINTGTVICSSSSRVTPPTKASRSGEWW